MKVFILALLIAIPFVTYRQDKREESDPSVVKGVRFSVELVGKELYRQRDSIPLKLRLENTNKSRIYLFKHLGFGPGGFRISIVDANNRGVRPNFIAESFPPPVWTKNDFQAIEPGKSFEQQIQLNLQFYDIEPGDHTLFVSFLSPVPAAVDVPSGLSILTSSDYFEAKPIKFKVLYP